MQPHTIEQLNGLRSYVDSQMDYAEFAISGLEVKYRLIHLSDEQKPFDYAVAAAVVVENNIVDYEIAVSDDVPEGLRDLWAWHELYDFAVVGHETEHRCLTSEQKLLEGLRVENPEIIEDYVGTRIEFYESLGRYMASDITNNPQTTFDTFDVVGALEAREFLTNLVV